jgi:ubiquinone biosynthesis protein Coq4
MDVIERDAAGTIPAAKNTRTLNENESRYMQGSREPVTSSVLISNSKYLNNPYYRDTFAQMALRRHGHDLPETYLIPNMIKAITEVKDIPEFIRLIGEEKAKNPEFAQWLDARRSTPYTLDMVQGYAEGTLGAAIRAFLSKGDMSMEFMMQGEATSDLDYIIKQRVIRHDVEHLVTGFGPNQLGEEALAICNVTATARYFTPALAQHLSDYPVFVSVCSYKRVSLHYPAAMPDYLDAMRRGITAGQALKKPLFMVEWDDYLDRQLDDIAAELGFERGPGSGWDWSLQACSG